MSDEPPQPITNTVPNYGAQGIFNGPVTFQQILDPTPIPYRTIVLRMVEDYAAVFGGRTLELEALDAWLETGNDPFALLIAPTGRGKTALLIHWVAQVQTYGRWSVVFAPISVRYGTASADMTLRALAHALAAVHNEHEHLQTLNQSPDQLRPLIAEYLRRPLPDNRCLLLVLDGLDEATGWQFARDLFPRIPGPHLRILAAARQLAHKNRNDWCEQLGWLPARTHDVTLGGLNHASVEDVLLQMGDPLGHLADSAAVVSEMTRISQGDPLTIRLLIEALQHAEITLDQLTRMPPGLEAYMRDWLTELRHQADHSGVDMLLRLCAGALGPLHSTDLRTLALHAFPRHLDVQSAAERVQRFVIGDGTAENGYIFSHPGLRELFWERLLDNDERATVTQQFLAYGELHYDQYREQLSNTPVHVLSQYVLLFWPTHLALNGNWERLYDVVTEVLPVGDAYMQPWAEARFGVENSYVGYLSDLDHLWRYAETTNDTVLGVRCALLAASIRSLSNNFSPELLVGLVTVGTPKGKWSVPLALAYVRQMPDPEHRATVLTELLKAGFQLPWDNVFAIVRTLHNSGQRSRVLGQFISHLPSEAQPTILADALAAVRTVEDAKERVRAFISLIPFVPTEQQSSILTEIVPSLLAITDPYSSGRAFGELISQIPHAYHNNLLEAVYDIEDPFTQAITLGEIIKSLPEDWQNAVVTKALSVVQTIESAENRVLAQASFVNHLSEDMLRELVSDACSLELHGMRSMLFSLIVYVLPEELVLNVLECIYIMETQEQSYALGLIAAFLPPELVPNAWAVALAAAPASRSDDIRSFIIGRFAPRLPSDRLSDLLVCATSIPNEYQRAEALRYLARYLSPELCADALTIAYAIDDEWVRGQALGWLAPYLSHKQLMHVLAAVRAFQSDVQRARGLGVLVPSLPTDMIPVVLHESAIAARTIADSLAQIQALEALFSTLPVDTQPAALEAVFVAACRVEDERGRGEALLLLARHLSMPALTGALTIAYNIHDPMVRCVTLANLASYLPPDQQYTALTDALTAARAMQNAGDRAQMLAQLAPELPREYQQSAMQEVVAAIYHIVNDTWRTLALGQCIPLLPRDFLADVLPTIRTIGNEWSLVSTWKRLGPDIPLDQQRIMLADICSLRNIFALLNAIEELASYLSNDLLHDFLRIIRTVEPAYHRAQALGKIAPHLPLPEQSVVLTEALTIAQTIADAFSGATLLGELVPHLPISERPAVIEQALVTAQAIQNNWSRVQALEKLVLHLLPDHYTRALTIVRAINDVTLRTTGLSMLVVHLPLELQHMVLDEILADMYMLDNEQVRMKVLHAILLYLSSEQQASILDTLRTSGNQPALADVLKELVLNGQTRLIPDALQAVSSVDGNGLAPFVPALVANHGIPISEHLTLLNTTLRTLALQGRSELLKALAALVPWFATLTTPEQRSEVVQTIIDVVRCWP